MKQTFDPGCRLCPRLATFLDEVRERYPDYHAAPVPPFGHSDPHLFIVGLAPGMHGANRTGRPFTGDFAGVLLYQTLHKFGYASHAAATEPDDGLVLSGVRISNAVKCLPPQNKPIGAEINECNRFLANEIAALKRPLILMALGGIAHRAIIRSQGLRQKDFKFGHAVVHQLQDDLTLVNSYHCSRYNTQTRRLTPGMFEQVFSIIQDLRV